MTNASGSHSSHDHGVGSAGSDNATAGPMINATIAQPEHHETRSRWLLVGTLSPPNESRVSRGASVLG